MTGKVGQGDISDVGGHDDGDDGDGGYDGDFGKHVLHGPTCIVMRE